ncbi:MAG: hypothetical protein AABY64_09275 [Bdellovibrionota bacterium]
MKKYLIVFLLISVYFSTSFAFVSNAPIEKDYKFIYHVAGHTLEFNQKAGSYEDAMEKVALKCFQELKGPKKINEEKGLDIIDICANPRAS